MKKTPSPGAQKKGGVLEALLKISKVPGLDPYSVNIVDARKTPCIISVTTEGTELIRETRR